VQHCKEKSKSISQIIINATKKRIKQKINKYIERIIPLDQREGESGQHMAKKSTSFFPSFSPPLMPPRG